MKKLNWIIVPREYVKYGAPAHGMTGNMAFATESEAWDYIESAIADLRSATPKTDDGSDYISCRIAEWQAKTVVRRGSLRERSYDEARELHHRWPQYY